MVCVFLFLAYFTLYQGSRFIHLSSVQFSHSVMSDSWRLRRLQHARPPCPSSTPRVYSNLCPLSRWCHPWWYEKASPQFNWLKFVPFYGWVIFHWIYVSQLLYSFITGPLGCFHVLDHQEVWDGVGEGGRFKREGICVHFWVFHMYGRKQHNS